MTYRCVKLVPKAAGLLEGGGDGLEDEEDEV